VETTDNKEDIGGMIPPSQKQEESIDFLVDAVLEKKQVVGFIAPGGCGKTFSLKHFANDQRISGIDITFTATTNKAAAVMKKEGVKGAKTLHAAISKHVSTAMYINMENMFDLKKKSPEVVQDFPSNVLEFLEEISVRPENFFDYKNEKELIAENSVSPFDDRIFSHYVTGGYKGGVCSIDEASMLPTKSQYQKDNDDDGFPKMKSIGLDSVLKVFDTVILVGDDSQLPPINGTSSFDDIEKTTLTENFRSDKGLLRFLDYIRKGGNVADFVPQEDENVRIVASVGDEYFEREKLIENEVTHIVFRNKTRKDITKQIRTGLTSEPELNEPIVYKGANIDNPNDSISKNETGFFNGMMGEWDNHSQVVQGRNFDEYGIGFTYLQYAYAITAHTAQGSSFDYVVIHNDDVPHFIDSETKRKWIYTAASRARKGIVVVY
jgi:ATP-dependent exoDNAse (exonuclease V) alpha subunit